MARKKIKKSSTEKKKRQREELKHISNVRGYILFIHLFFQSFEHLVRTYYMSSSVPDVKDIKNSPCSRSSPDRGMTHIYSDNYMFQELSYKRLICKSTSRYDTH